MARFEIFEVVEGVWCVRHRPRLSCAYVIKTSPGAFLVDAGPSPSASGMLMGLQRARVGLMSVRAIVLTHWASDHAAGARFLKERTGTRVLYAREAEPYFTGERSTPWLERLRGRAAPPPVVADAFLENGERVGGMLDVIAPAGDGNGRLAFYLAERKMLFSGDGPIPDVDVDLVLPAHGHVGKSDGTPDSRFKTPASRER